MLQPPTNDRKTKADASAKTAEQLPDQEQSLQLLGGMGRSHRSQLMQHRENLAALQNAYGNQVALRMLRTEKRRSPSMNPIQGGILQRKCACGNASGAEGTCMECQKKQELSLQTKLSISEPGDQYEQEADRVAEQVMRMPLSEVHLESSVGQLQRQNRSDSEKSNQQSIVGSNISVSETSQLLNGILSSNGQPLDSKSRAFMEPRFGQDFSYVKVHTDAKAAESAQTINALAYTAGNNIVFGTGQYAPGTLTGRQLLAHELTHVVQQSGRLIQDSRSGPKTDASSNKFESRAKWNATQIHTNARPLVHSQNLPPSIQRVGSGLPATTPRPDPDIEQQRLEAIKQVSDNCIKIHQAAEQYGIIPEAISGAILWEALENPYFRPFSRLGPGKVHPYETFGKSEAEKVEAEKRVPASKDTDERKARLQNVGWAITYIAAIMQRHADNYKKIAGVDITNNPGVLCTLYQGGHSEERAKKLAERRKTDPNAQPVPGDEMGPWVEKNIKFIKNLCLLVEPPGSPKQSILASIDNGDDESGSEQLTEMDQAAV